MKLLIPFFTLLIIGISVLLSMQANDGHFVYTLDDPYIHLDLAEQLWRTGVYGVNEGIHSAPSSSILWPELLMLGAGTNIHIYVPFALSVLFALLSSALLPVIFAHIFPARPTAVLIASLMAVITISLPAHAMGGMEHSLQILLTLLAVLGLIRFHETQRVPAWLWLVLILGPLVRYENLLVSAASLAILFHGRQRGGAVLTGLIIVALVGGFSAFLLSLGLDAMPSSTIVKRLRWGGDYWGFWQAALMIILINPLAWVMLAGGATAGIWALGNWQWNNTRWFSTALLAGMVLCHLFVGRFGGADYPRYEIYLFIFAGFYGFWLWRDEILTALKTRPPMVGLAFLCVPLMIAPGFMGSFVNLVSASHAIYLQQYQMARLAHDYWRKPIAVNDIGIVGYRNPNYVLDLVGLADREARIAAWSADPLAVDAYIRSRDVELVLVYRRWFKTPARANWHAVGELFRPADLTGFGDGSVLFMTPYADRTEAIRAALRPWAATLPAGTLYVEYDDSHPAPPGDVSPEPPQPLKTAP